MVLVENQLERTDHTHLGQLMTYAAGLNAVTIVWIAARFTEEHRAGLDWLIDIANDEFNFFGLEVELWQIGESPVAQKFNIVSKPNAWTRSISGAANRLKDAEISETQRLQLEYWTEFQKVLSVHAEHIRGTKTLPQYWNNFAIGRSDFVLYTFANTRDKRIGVILVCGGKDAKAYFHLLAKQKQSIEAALDENLDWREMPQKKQSHVASQRNDTDPADRASWPEQRAWLAKTLAAMHDRFRPLIKQLDTSEYEPSDTE